MGNEFTFISIVIKIHIMNVVTSFFCMNNVWAKIHLKKKYIYICWLEEKYKLSSNYLNSFFFATFDHVISLKIWKMTNFPKLFFNFYLFLHFFKFIFLFVYLATNTKIINNPY